MCIACALVPAPDASTPFPTSRSPLALPQGAAGGHLTWTGVAGVLLEWGGARLAFDPFVSRPPLLEVLFAAPLVDRTLVAHHFRDVDAVFVGHTHYDHAMDLPAVVAASPKARIHGSRTTVELARRLGIPEANLVELRDGERYDIAGTQVEAVRIEHGKVPLVRHVDRIEMPRRGVPPTPFRYPRGEVFAFRVKAEGTTWYVQGSAGIDEAALRRQRPVDVLLACLAARQGTPRYLERLGERLRPRVLVPIHHDDFFRPLDAEPRPIAGLGWGAFRRDAARLAERYETRLWCPPRAQRIDV